jgi:hypothetical protein
MTHVWIVQCLCPARHCILANAGTADGAEDAKENLEGPLREAIGEMLASGVFNPWCGLCKARSETWRYEARRTQFATMAEAMPHLKRLEDVQRIAAAVFGDIPRSD